MKTGITSQYHPTKLMSRNLNSIFIICLHNIDDKCQVQDLRKQRVEKVQEGQREGSQAARQNK